jgi:hypothetical protein
LTAVNGVYPRSFSSAAYASANGANGPVINTLLTLLDGPAIAASFSENKKDDDRQHRWRYADPTRRSAHQSTRLPTRSA